VWVLTEDPHVHAAARILGGHAQCWRGAGAAFPPLEPGLATLSGRVKAAFDPLGVLNPGRMS